MRGVVVTVASLLLGVGAGVLGAVWWTTRRTAHQLQQLQGEVDRAVDLRQMERRGRTRAEKRLRELAGQLSPTQHEEEHLAMMDASSLGQSSDSEGSASGSSWTGTPKEGSARRRAQDRTLPVVPIGFLESCFMSRNGTPRQSQLVTESRAQLLLRRDLASRESLSGLEEFSHVWVIFEFHLNTNGHKAMTEHGRFKFKPLVRPPRLGGAKRGVFATRTPHRPNPIGLSLARLLDVRPQADGQTALLFGGLDLVDGTPILDIKPFIPEYDQVSAEDGGRAILFLLLFHGSYPPPLCKSLSKSTPCFSCPSSCTRLGGDLRCGSRLL